MKVFFGIISFLIFLSFSDYTKAESWKNDWTVNGVQLKNFTHKDIGELALGAITSATVHYLGHVAYMSVAGIDWHQDGFYEMMDYNTSDSDVAMSGRSGFILQLAVGTVLKYSRWNESIFTLGYNIQSMIEITTYPIRYSGSDKGDLDAIAKEGDRDIEYFIYSGYSIWLLKK